ncbi:MAG TPA: hypothetical protein VK661_08145 [Planctomycetota bacterium]|jgi:hypothetical protein|nr:hypothetical protein [Planctomycetota bacterium]
MARFTLAVLAAALSLAAAQDEMIDNPEYKGWAGQKVGAWVKFKTERTTGDMKMDSTTTTTLKEMTAEKAVIEQAIEMDMGGQKRTMNMSRTLPAKVKKGTDSEGAKVEINGEGNEELEIKGAKYPCHWVEMNITSKQGVATMKVWRCDKIIGSMAKMVMTVKDKMTMTNTAMDWKAGE